MFSCDGLGPDVVRPKTAAGAEMWYSEMLACTASAPTPGSCAASWDSSAAAVVEEPFTCSTRLMAGPARGGGGGGGGGDTGGGGVLKPRQLPSAALLYCAQLAPPSGGGGEGLAGGGGAAAAPGGGNIDGDPHTAVTYMDSAADPMAPAPHPVGADVFGYGR